MPPASGKHTTAVTTLPMSTRAHLAQTGYLLSPQQVIASPETRVRYRIDRLLGEGGFGQVYLAGRVGRSRTVPSVVCIKASARIDGWLREAYFGQLLDGHPRAIAVYDAFPLMEPGGRVLYCLALEYARQGDLQAYLEATGKPWPESTARREIAGILQVLGKLHRGQMLHRDLTPMNVFVCDRRCLKLGDFGITRHQSDRRGIQAGTMNPLTAPNEILAGSAPKWQARDDVYQVGQLLGMLVKGDARARIRTGEIRGLRCSDHLKEIVYRCIGERRKRYESAQELIDALGHPPARLKAGCCGRSRARTSRSPEFSCGDAPKPRAPRSARERPCTEARRRRRRSSSAAGPTRCRPRDAREDESSWRSNGCARRVTASRS